MNHDAIAKFGEALATLAAEIAADIIEERLRREPQNRYATAAHNPIGSRRQFLDAARAGKFDSFKRGREVAARWVDVERSIESTKPSRRTPPELESELRLAATPRRGRARRG
jgi:hypothetical protein